MTKFFTLSVTFFLNSFRANKKKNRSGLQTASLFGLILLAVSVFYNVFYHSSMSEMGVSEENYLLMVLTFSTMFGIMMFLFQGQSILFKSSDYEFLQSLPLNDTLIVSSKLNALYLLSLAEDLIICLPALVIYLMNQGSIYVGFVFFISLFFISFLPLLISALLVSLISLITSHFKHQNLINIIFTVGLMILLMAGSFALSYGMSFAQGGQVINMVNTLPYISLIGDAFDTAKFYELLIFIAINLISAVAVVFIISRFYYSLNARLRYVNHDKKEYQGGNEKIDKIENVLFTKEIRSLTGNPQYLINSFLGPLMYLLLAIFFTIIMASGIDEFTGEGEHLIFTSVMISIIAGMGVMMNMIASSSSSSISLEGKNFELLKSYPLEVKKILDAKLKVSILIPLGLNLIFSSIVMIVLKINFDIDIFLMLQMLILPLLSVVYTGYLGLLCNLRWPKIDFSDASQVFRNSLSSGLTTLFGMIVSLMIIVIIVLLNIFTSALITLLVSAGVLILLDVMIAFIYSRTYLKRFLLIS